MIYILYDIILRLMIPSFSGDSSLPIRSARFRPLPARREHVFGHRLARSIQTHRAMSLSFRRGNRSQRDEDTAVTIAELKQGQDKLVELVQVSVRTACPLSSLPPTNPCTHTHARTHILHVCHRKTRHPGLVITRASTVSCGRSRRSRVRS